MEDSLEELAALARTAGIEVLGATLQRLSSPNPATFIGKGKVEELKAYKAQLQPDLIIFDDELSPAQERNLERELDLKILDRTALILDIFAQHAHTREGALQVELAQYEYRLPRLTRMWTHLARQAGGAAGRGGTGGVGLRGPGETQLETDRREIQRRISHLKEQLEEVRAHRRLYRRKRQKAKVPVVAIVGYTNSGKSTLLNAIAHAGVLVEDKLFATLDPTTRRVKLPDGREALFTDTVGFIQKLPAQIVASFRATLEEMLDADLLLHVIDITHPNVREQTRAVEEILKELGAEGKPMVTALNKIDLLSRSRPGPDSVGTSREDLAGQGLSGQGFDLDPGLVAEIRHHFPNTIPISAARGIGLERLLGRVGEVLQQEYRWMRVLLPYGQDGLLSIFHRLGLVEREKFTPSGVLVEGKLPPSLEPLFEEYAQ